MDAKALYKMKLGDTLYAQEINRLIERVPGGWIYVYIRDIDLAAAVSSTFVPMNSEFRRQEPKA